MKDMARHAGCVKPGGTNHVTLYRRFDPTAVLASRSRHTGAGRDWSSGVWSSDLSAVTVTRAGRYRWIASYSGDPNNNAVSTSCGDAGETSTVTKATPTLTTSAKIGRASCRERV